MAEIIPELVRIFSQIDNIPSLKRAMLRNWLPRYWFDEYSGASILQSMREAGRGIRTSDFYEIQRQRLAQPIGEQDFQELPVGALIPRAWFREDHGLELSRKAHYRFKVYYRDLETGDTGFLVRHVSSDWQLDPDEATALISQYYPLGLEYQGFVIEDIAIFDVWAKPGAKLLRW